MGMTTTNHEFSQIMTAASTKTVTNESSSISQKRANSTHDLALDTDVERKQITEPIRTRVKGPGGKRLPSRFKKMKIDDLLITCIKIVELKLVLKILNF